jgi:hypothetical protein
MSDAGLREPRFGPRGGSSSAPDVGLVAEGSSVHGEPGQVVSKAVSSTAALICRASCVGVPLTGRLQGRRSPSPGWDSMKTSSSHRSLSRARSCGDRGGSCLPGGPCLLPPGSGRAPGERGYSARDGSPLRHVREWAELPLSGADVQRRTGARAIRVVGDPNARVSRVQLGVGHATPPASDPAIGVVMPVRLLEAGEPFWVPR